MVKIAAAVKLEELRERLRAKPMQRVLLIIGGGIAAYSAELVLLARSRARCALFADIGSRPVVACIAGERVG